MKKLCLILAAVIAAPFALAQDEAKLELTGNDMMQYNTKTLEVVTGQKVTLTFKHIGKLPIAAMGHNVVILKPGTDIPKFATACVPAKDTGYIPQDEDSKAKIVAHTELVGGGDSSTVTFTAPEPGEYPYICTFPGHFSLMQGVLTVKPKP
ncbi:azurin [Luteolibacter pohnpeiensis]|uniref:Azurin n=1 Tax=Luteolibacter pohnpeiensis TaxID=454153 RepID=A0A934S561_9BACT|nr:azurin [Luteolibacter pohnpeiensis]MBK1883300.1 azurin [Luteolibacter pohnpeiensis]